MNRQTEIMLALKNLYKKHPNGVTASQIADELSTDRSNISRILNQFVKDRKCSKKKSRPVLFTPLQKKFIRILHQKNRIKLHS